MYLFLVYSIVICIVLSSIFIRMVHVTIICWSVYDRLLLCDGLEAQFGMAQLVAFLRQMYRHLFISVTGLCCVMDCMQARFGKTRLAAAMRVMYGLPETLIWGAELYGRYMKAYPMAEVTHLTSPTPFSLDCVRGRL